MPYLKEFYIIPVGGNLIYSKGENKEIDQVLFSGFLAGLNTFSKNAFSQEIFAFTLGESKYISICVNDLLFVARTNTKTKDAEIKQVLQEMQAIFFANFPPPDSNKNGWGGNLTQFSILDKKYDRFFAGSSDKALKAIW